jgi:hypothetical protein
MDRFENVATPFVEATVVVPLSVPPPGFVPNATVTLPVYDVRVFPALSRAVTCTAGLRDAPAVVLLGCAVKTSCDAGIAIRKSGSVSGFEPKETHPLRRPVWLTVRTCQ